MLESNPPRNSQLETHPNDELGRRPCGRRSYHLDRFPYAFKTHQEKNARSASMLFCRSARDSKVHVVAFRVVFSGVADEGAVRLR